MIKPLPIIFDTDIGSDIDDTWALVMALKSPEIDIKLVTVCSYDVEYQAKLAAKTLEVANRTDIPVGVGLGGFEAGRPEEEWVRDYDLDSYPNLRRDGVDAIIETVMKSDEIITILMIGSFKNIAAAYKKEPRIAEKCRIVALAGNIYNGFCRGWHPDLASEWNIRCDLQAWREGIENTDLDVELLPLDVSGGVLLPEPLYKKVRDAAKSDALLEAMIYCNDIWGVAENWKYYGPTSPLFDTVGVYALITHKNLNFTKLPVYANDKSITYIDPERGKEMNVALSWDDKDKFYDFLAARLCGEI